MKIVIGCIALVALTACSGNRLNSGSTVGATGPISSACLAADRSAATRSLCSCIQGVANAELSARDRSRVATFFTNPETANDVKISDTNANDAFWDRYRGFISRARSQCG